MRHVIARRLLLSLPVLMGVLLIGFMLLVVVPSDPAAIIAGEGATAEIIAAIRHNLGLDRPVLVQFLLYLLRVLHGDLGNSIFNKAPVIDELLRTIGPTCELMAGGLLVAIPTGITLGTVSATMRGRWGDRAIMMLSVAGLSMPGFMIGLLSIQYVGLAWGLLPFEGRGGPVWTWNGFTHIILPSITLGSILIGPIARMTRASVLEALGQDFIRTARAKGLGEFKVVVKHALRTALIPVVTLIGLQAGYLLGGAVVTETIFSWPGIGRLAVTAISSGDFPMAQGTILTLAISFLVMNLLVDVIYSLLDPRVRL